MRNKNGHTYETYCAHMAAQQVTPMKHDAWKRELQLNKYDADVEGERQESERYEPIESAWLCNREY